MSQFLRGALAMACVVVALFFLRSWKLGKDRFFLLFATSFVLLALNWVLLALNGVPSESGHYVYVLRFLAFATILAAIIDKNIRSRG